MILTQDNILQTCLERLGDSSDYLLRKWVILCIAQMWAQNDEIRDNAVRESDATEALIAVLGEEQASPDVRAAILYALSTFLGASGTRTLTAANAHLLALDPPSASPTSLPGVPPNPQLHTGGSGSGMMPSLSFNGHYLLEARIATNVAMACREDSSVLVRKEMVVLISCVVRAWKGHFISAAWIYWEEERAGGIGGVGGNHVRDGFGFEEGERTWTSPLVATALAAYQARVSRRQSDSDNSDDSEDPTQTLTYEVLSGYFTLFALLLEFSIDPFPDVTELAQSVVDWIVERLVESPFAALRGVGLKSAVDTLERESAKAKARNSGLRTRVASLGSLSTTVAGSTGGTTLGAPSRPPSIRANSLASSSTTASIHPTASHSAASTTTSSTLKRTSSFANALKSLGTYAFPTLESFSRPASPDHTSHRPQPGRTQSHSRSRAASPHHYGRNSYYEAEEDEEDVGYEAVDVIETLIEEDLMRLRNRRDGRKDLDPEEELPPQSHRTGNGVGVNGSAHGRDGSDGSTEEERTEAGEEGKTTLPLKSKFYDWCNEYFMEPQMRVSSFLFTFSLPIHGLILGYSKRNRTNQGASIITGSYGGARGMRALLLTLKPRLCWLVCFILSVLVPKLNFLHQPIVNGTALYVHSRLPHQQSRSHFMASIRISFLLMTTIN